MTAFDAARKLSEASSFLPPSALARLREDDQPRDPNGEFASGSGGGSSRTGGSGKVDIGADDLSPSDAAAVQRADDERRALQAQQYEPSAAQEGDAVSYQGRQGMVSRVEGGTAHVVFDDAYDDETDSGPEEPVPVSRLTKLE